MNNEPVAYENTDKEIWREIPDDYYAPSIFVTAQNTIGINVGGSVHVKHVHEWHRLAHPIKEHFEDEPQADNDAQKWLEQHQKYQRYELIKAKELGIPHHINQHGEVIHDTNRKLIPK